MAKRANIPGGWSYEGPDPSVGIFGEEWIHEDCEVLTGPGHDEYQGVGVLEKQVGTTDNHGMALIVRTLSCKDCGEETLFDSVEFVGVDEPLDEVEHVG